MLSETRPNLVNFRTDKLSEQIRTVEAVKVKSEAQQEARTSEAEAAVKSGNRWQSDQGIWLSGKSEKCNCCKSGALINQASQPETHSQQHASRIFAGWHDSPSSIAFPEHDSGRHQMSGCFVSIFCRLYRPDHVIKYSNTTSKVPRKLKSAMA
ncbi:hypothetical protein CEXT_623051 [Caerostris extrusa]|uniref:Uncharacterized protein n=1 Tax=Caerostris extrusa TaxID=172846 RepID=A0AAV4N155_CAEEX|nr:hypothetical protein CEXT_623051 [Caerostris extrusa]